MKSILLWRAGDSCYTDSARPTFFTQRQRRAGYGDASKPRSALPTYARTANETSNRIENLFSSELARASLLNQPGIGHGCDGRSFRILPLKRRGSFLAVRISIKHETGTSCKIL